MLLKYYLKLIKWKSATGVLAKYTVIWLRINNVYYAQLQSSIGIVIHFDSK